MCSGWWCSFPLALGLSVDVRHEPRVQSGRAGRSSGASHTQTGAISNWLGTCRLARPTRTLSTSVYVGKLRLDVAIIPSLRKARWYFVSQAGLVVRNRLGA